MSYYHTTPSHQVAINLCHHSYWNTNYESAQTGVAFYCQIINGIKYFAFPGTQTLSDWITNFKLRSLVTPFAENGYKGEVKLHQGYYEGYLSIQSRILAECDTHLPCCFGGHSSGGAVAQIGGTDVNYRLNKRITVITFGTPACGNKAWKESAGRRIVNYSYENLFDIVPHLFTWNSRVTNPITNNLLYRDPHSTISYMDSLKKLSGKHVLNTRK